MTRPCIDEHAAERFLEDHLGHQVSHVEYVGEGAWSRCFGFADRGRDLVVRFGRFVEDFEKDRRAASLRSPQLPVPEMLEIGRAFDGFFAITSRAHGKPIESLTSKAWQNVLPSRRDAYCRPIRYKGLRQVGLPWCSFSQVVARVPSNGR